MMTGPARILRRWRERCHRTELPIVTIPAVMDDDDVDAWGDAIYLRGLLDHVAQHCNLRTRLRPIPAAWSAELDAALELASTTAFWAAVTA